MMVLAKYKYYIVPALVLAVGSVISVHAIAKKPQIINRVSNVGSGSNVSSLQVDSQAKSGGKPQVSLKVNGKDIPINQNGFTQVNVPSSGSDSANSSESNQKIEVNVNGNNTSSQTSFVANGNQSDNQSSSFTSSQVNMNSNSNSFNSGFSSSSQFVNGQIINQTSNSN